MTKTLPACDYWKVRAICSEAQRCELIVITARDALTAAHKKQTAVLADLGLDATAPSFVLDDDTLSITFPEAPPEAGRPLVPPPPARVPVPAFREE